MSSAHFPTFPSLHLRDRSLSNPSVALPTSQFILQPFRCFTYVTAHSPTLLSLLLRHRLFTWRTAHGEESKQFSTFVRQLVLLILQPFRHFTYVKAHYPTLPSLHLRHSSFSNPSVASHTSPGEPSMHTGMKNSPSAPELVPGILSGQGRYLSPLIQERRGI